MNAMPSTDHFPEQPGRRGFVRAVVGSSLAATAGMTAASASTTASATASGAAEPGLPFHAWAPAPPMGWNSWDAFGASVTEAEYLDNARRPARRHPHALHPPAWRTARALRLKPRNFR